MQNVDLNRSTEIRNKNGFTLVELLVVIAIIAILSVFVVPRITAAFDRSNAKAVVDDVTQILGAAISWKGIKTSYAGITFNDLTNSGLLRAAWGAGNGVNPKNGDYTVASAGTQVTVTATNLGNELCNNVLHSMEGSVANVSCAGGTLTVTN